jgi:hypothetical protein
MAEVNRLQVAKELEFALGKDFINTIKRNIIEVVNIAPCKNTMYFFADILLDLPTKNVNKRKLTQLIKTYSLHAIKTLLKDIINIPDIKILYITTDFFTHYNDTLFKLCQKIYWLADKHYYLPKKHIRTTLKCSFMLDR